jgi:hypothetical protein
VLQTSAKVILKGRDFLSKYVHGANQLIITAREEESNA